MKSLIVQLDQRHGAEAAGKYKYGFQGQETDDEIKGEGNSVNYNYRMHDPRIGRFFAIDPLASKYPWYTPYQFSGNKLISYRELEGLEEFGAITFNSFFVETSNAAFNTKTFETAVGSYLKYTGAGATLVITFEIIGLEMIIDYFCEEAVEYYIEKTTGIPVITDPKDLFENLSKKGVKKLANKVKVYGKTFTNVENAKNFTSLVKKYKQASATAIWDRAKLRKTLSKGVVPAGKWEAHHVIPVELVKGDIRVRNAIEQGWDFNSELNGVAMSITRHKGSHPKYTAMVTKLINTYENSGKYENEKELMQAVSKEIKNRINQNSTKTIEQIGEMYK